MNLRAQFLKLFMLCSVPCDKQVKLSRTPFCQKPERIEERERIFFPRKPAGWQYGQPGYGGRPDGAAVDAEGCYWVAMFEGARVLRLSPQGEILQELPLPAQCPTMPCFGGEDLKTLYVTTARHKRGAQELADYPQSGCVFSTRVSVPGLPVNFFQD